MHRKYSKTSAFYLSTKRDFFSQNSAHLEKALLQNAIYRQQPRRCACKLCGSELPNIPDFVSHSIEYCFCLRCGHLNGLFEDTKQFVDRLYIADSGAEYSKAYLSTDFDQRVSDIYLPKIDFALEALEVKPRRMLDVGCGSGYLVLAALSRGIEVSGIDVSEAMIAFGNEQIAARTGLSPLSQVEESELYEQISETKAELVTAVGVIEHLREPSKFFGAFKASGARHLLYSVPMFSVSVLLEVALQSMFPRQLSGGHTHLFTESSLEKMNEILDVKSIAEWRFGTDGMDLFRGIGSALRDQGASEMSIRQLNSGLGSRIDEIQAVLDRGHFCSEIHCLVERS